MDQQQEQALVRRAQQGSAAAFEPLVREYQHRLLRFLMLRGLRRADAEDVTQTAFLEAWRQLHSYQPRWRFSTWLYTIARRTPVPPLPQAANQAAIREQVQDISREMAQDLDPCLRQQMRDNLWTSARRLLDLEAFTALWLHYGEGFTGAEIARIVNRSPVAVRVGLHRSRQRLRQHWDRGITTETAHETRIN